MRRPALGALLFLGLALAQTLKEAQGLLEAGRYREAAALFEALLVQDYGRPEYHLGLGVALYREGRLEEARFAFAQMTKVFPNRYEGYYNLGQVELRLGNLEGAIGAFQKAVELSPREEAYLALAGALAKGGRLGEAATVLQKGLTEERSPSYRLALAQALERSGQGPKAVPLLYGLLNQDPKMAEAWVLLARILVQEGLKARALRELNRGLEVVQGKERGRLLLEKARLVEDPLPLLREAFLVDPGLWEAPYLMGRRLLEKGDLQGALAQFTAAYRIAPEPEVALAMASVYLRLGRYGEAYRLAKEAGPLGILARAEAAYRLGRREEALRLLEKERSPEALAWKGALLLELGRPEEALEPLAQAYAARRDPKVGVNLGAALVGAGRHQEAEPLLQALVVQSPSLAPAWYNLGLALKGLGRLAEAERALRQAARLGSKEAQALLGR